MRRIDNQELFCRIFLAIDYINYTGWRFDLIPNFSLKMGINSLTELCSAPIFFSHFHKLFS